MKEAWSRINKMQVKSNMNITGTIRSVSSNSISRRRATRKSRKRL
jgi:hypothetical protein